MIIGSLQIDSRRDSVLWGIDKGPNTLILVGSIAQKGGGVGKLRAPRETPALKDFKA